MKLFKPAWYPWILTLTLCLGLFAFYSSSGRLLPSQSDLKQITIAREKPDETARTSYQACSSTTGQIQNYNSWTQTFLQTIGQGPRTLILQASNAVSTIKTLCHEPVKLLGWHVKKPAEKEENDKES